MIPLLVSTALAGPPLDSGHSVTALVWALPFTLATPEPWTMTARPEPVDRGLLLELRADPSLLFPKDVGASVLYVGDTPAWLFDWDHVGGCVVAWVPGAPDLTETEIYFGSTELPERVDAAHGAAERAAARALGVVPFSAADVALARSAAGPELRAADFREVAAVALRRVAACTSTPEDLDRLEP